MIKIAFALVALFCLSSCATIFQGSRKDVTIRSTTPDATIYVDGVEKGKDAVTALLARKHNHVIVVKKEGCEMQTVEIKKHAQVGWIIWDSLELLYANIFPLPIDAITGAWNTFDKKNVVVELKCQH